MIYIKNIIQNVLVVDAENQIYRYTKRENLENDISLLEIRSSYRPFMYIMTSGHLKSLHTHILFKYTM